MIDIVFNIVDDVLNSNIQIVTIDWKKVDNLIKQMKKDGPTSFPILFDKKTGIYIEILKEIVANSINYCYWYGAHDIRPNGISSTKMYEHVEQVFNHTQNHTLNFESRIDDIIELLSINRYPLLDERKRHLWDLCEGRKAEVFATDILKNQSEQSGEFLFRKMVKVFHGYASDIFLKRASLFFIQLHRKYGWYNNDDNDLMSILPVPADYQVPKVLRHFGCIVYTPSLEEDIYESKLIPKHSLAEIQIRAATIKVCETLRKKLNWTIADVDTYLWCKRKITDIPFHCTITTDY